MAKASGEVPVSTLEKSGSEETLSNSRSQDGKPTTASSRFPNGYKLPHHYAGLWLAIFFAVLTIVSWTITCILSYRPLYASSYRHADRSWKDIAESTRAKNLRYYRASSILESIVNVLIIPVATAVCVKAAVTYTQKQKHQVNARKALILADRGWTSVSTFWKLLWPEWRRKNLTRFLVLASLLTLLGFIIAPVKSVLVTQGTIKTPSRWVGGYTSTITDWRDLFHDQRGPIVAAQLVGELRSKLMSTPPYLEQPNLWVRSVEDDMKGYGNGEKPAFTLSTMQEMKHPFMCQVPTLYNTGLLRQYAPSLNSTVEASRLSHHQEWPKECGNSNLNFYRQYSDGAATLEFCMPGNLTSSPWTPSGDRQDITETLLIRAAPEDATSATVLRVVASTTFGFFELPNILNNNIAGPVLEKMPELGGRGGQIVEDLGYIKNMWPPIVHSGMPLEHVVNRGPLLTTALAMFGDGSLLALASQSSSGDATKAPVACEEWYLAFADLWWDFPPSCDHLANVENLASRLSVPQGKVSFLELVLERAVFLANQGMFTASQPEGRGPLVIKSDAGLDSPLPAMSLSSIIAISALLGLFLIGLFSMAIYSCTTAHWTGALDAFAILRVGAAGRDKLQYDLGQPLESVTALDEIPCWVGDATPEAEVGEITIGAEAPLKAQRTYTLSKSNSNLTS